jgi:nucleotide-binding universal stress UspA family protein
MNSGTLIIGIDLKDNNSNLFEKAVKFAHKLESSITLVHAIEYLPYFPYLPYDEEKYDEFAYAEIEKKMAELERKIISLGGNIRKSIVDKGKTYEVLSKTADKLNAKAILVGVGQNYLFDNLIGSTTEKVSRLAKQKVIIVNDKIETKVEEVLSAFDFSQNSINALRSAIKFSHFFKAKLIILHVYDSNEDELKILDHVSLATAPIVQEGFGKLGVTDYAGAELLIRKGNPVIETLAVIEEKKIDLLSIGASGNNALTRLFLGSTVAKIIRKSPCSVAVTPKIG